jgi:hypothetical protein
MKVIHFYPKLDLNTDISKIPQHQIWWKFRYLLSSCTELLGLFWTFSIVLYVEDKRSHNVSETDPVSETLWDFLSSTHKTMDEVQNKPNSSVQHTPSSESFQVYPFELLHVDGQIYLAKLISAF